MTIEYIVDERPFEDRVIHGLGYREYDALACITDPARCDEDFGSLMQTHSFFIVTDKNGKFLQKTRKSKEKLFFYNWCEHFKSSKHPFLVVRMNSCVIALYAKRYRIQKNTAWASKKRNM